MWTNLIPIKVNLPKLDGIYRKILLIGRMQGNNWSSMIRVTSTFLSNSTSSIISKISDTFDKLPKELLRIWVVFSKKEKEEYQYSATRHSISRLLSQLDTDKSFQPSQKRSSILKNKEKRKTK